MSATDPVDVIAWNMGALHDAVQYLRAHQARSTVGVVVIDQAGAFVPLLITLDKDHDEGHHTRNVTMWNEDDDQEPPASRA